MQVLRISDEDAAQSVVGTGISSLSLDGSTVVSRTASRNTSRGRTATTSRSRTPSIAGYGRIRDLSVESHRDVPGSRAPGEGKMRVGWIRE